MKRGSHHKQGHPPSIIREESRMNKVQAAAEEVKEMAVKLAEPKKPKEKEQQRR